jgi:hypothetical protein
VALLSRVVYVVKGAMGDGDAGKVFEVRWGGERDEYGFGTIGGVRDDVVFSFGSASEQTEVTGDG